MKPKTTSTPMSPLLCKTLSKFFQGTGEGRKEEKKREKELMKQLEELHKQNKGTLPVILQPTMQEKGGKKKKKEKNPIRQTILFPFANRK